MASTSANPEFKVHVDDENPQCTVPSTSNSEDEPLLRCSRCNVQKTFNDFPAAIIQSLSHPLSERNPNGERRKRKHACHCNDCVRRNQQRHAEDARKKRVRRDKVRLEGVETCGWNELLVMIEDG